MATGLEIEKLSPLINSNPNISSDLQLKRELKDQSSTDQNFSELLKQSLDQVNMHQHQADQAVKELLAGRNKNIHETLLAVERADSSLKLMMQVRNKVLEAYREIMRMQV